MRQLSLVLLTALVAACDGGGNGGVAPAPPAADPPPPPPPSAIFEVSAANLTLAQPLSPLALLVHDDSYRPFRIGESASAGLELLAEDGDNSEFLAEVEGRVEASGDAPLGPGASASFTLDLGTDDTSGALLSVMTMLVNTNDAITGINGVDISGMAVGDSTSVSAHVYDAGTEANSERAGTIPGPADGGEGFNAGRDDIADQVTLHGGVVSAADGLRDSVLNEAHRFDNPAARFTITRTQ